MSTKKPKKRPRKVPLTEKLSDWDQFLVLASEYAEAVRADEMKGGGDPISIPEIEAYLALKWEQFTGHVERMRRKYS